MHGSVDKTTGVWFLTDSRLLFVRNLTGKDPRDVVFVNVSSSIGLEVGNKSRIAADVYQRLYLVTPTNVTLLDCSKD